jgi:hypothetical protein
LVDSSNKPLVRQTDITVLPDADFYAATRAQFYGLASVDDYVVKLNIPFDYNANQPIHSSLHIGLHSSRANYAINFGFIENLLAEQNSLRNATASCIAYGISVGREAQMLTYMPGGVNAFPRFTTIDALINSASGTSNARPGSFHDALLSCS